jgi:hypothetical protein
VSSIPLYLCTTHSLLHCLLYTHCYLFTVYRRAAILRERQILGAIELQRLYRGYCGRKAYRVIWVKAYTLALHAQRIVRGHFGRGELTAPSVASVVQ